MRNLWAIGDRRHFRSKKNETRILVWFGLTIVVALLGLLCWTVVESPSYGPSLSDKQVSFINSRVAVSPPCRTEEKPSAWPVDVGTDIKSRFRSKIQESSATAGSAGIVEIDRDLMELAIHVALARGKIASGATDKIRVEADRHLFKPNVRAFLLMHRGLRFDVSEEPTLLTQGAASGRLVGVSKAMALDSMRLLIFEDPVCRQDGSFGIAVPSFPNGDAMFWFGHSSNILRLIASFYEKFVPTPSEPDGPGQAVLKVERELAESAALEAFAYDLVELVQLF